MRKIVSHVPPRHMDDWGAISLLLYLYPDAQVEYVHPQSVPEEYLQDRDIALVDVGQRYEPSLSNFDHHQDIEGLPCSLGLIIRHFFYNIPDSPAFQAIDLIDRYGFQEAVKRGLASPSKEVDRLRKIILLTPPGHEAGRILLDLLKYAGQVSLDHNSFIEMLYRALSVQGLTASAEKKIQEEEQAFQEKLQNVSYTTIEGFKVALSRESLAPFHSDFFSHTDTDILIEKNRQNPEHTSIIANTNKPYKDQTIALADKLSEDYPLVFRHQTGFIRVVSTQIENFFRRFLDENP